jgi:NADH-quinone oxidoreductase subunit M
VAFFRVLMVIAALGTVLAAAYLLWMYQRVGFGVPTAEFEDDPHIHDVTFTEWVAWTPMLILIVVLGVYPNLIFKVTDGAVGNIVSAFSGSGG